VFTEFNGDRNPGASVENAFATHFQRGRYSGHSNEPATFTLARFTRIEPHRMHLRGVR
jgi:hypothetical protein